MATLYFEMSGATFRELVEARLILEPIMVRQAALLRDSETVSRLNKMVESANKVDMANSTGYRVAVSDFHGIIAGASGNRILDLMTRALKDVFTSRINGMVFPAEDRDRIRADHSAVVEAISDGDADKAERLMREHMEEFAERVAQRYPGMLDEVVDWR